MWPLIAQPLRAQIVRTTITPAATAISWDDDLGLRNKGLYGGSLDFDFDRWVSLQGYFFTNSGVQTAAEKLGVNEDDAARLGDQRLKLRSYGANVKLHLGGGDISPYVDFGGGVLDFRPDNTERSRQIALNVGGGLRLTAFAPLHIDLFARDAMFRINRFALFEPPDGGTTPVDPDADKLRHNLVVGAGLGIPFGPSRGEAAGPIGETFWGLRGASFALEPMVGRLSFDTRNIDDQSLAGIRAGFDIGPLVGLRGFYWRGTSDSFTEADPVQSWGGEAQFRLNAGAGLTPFLLIGGGQLDFRSSFRDQADQVVSDETSFIAGGGVAIPMGERLALNLTARDYMFGERTNLEDVSSTNQLTHNWMWSAGLRFSVGGKRGSDLANERMRREAGIRRDLAIERARRDSLERMLAADDQRDDRAARGVSDTTMRTGDERRAMDRRTDADARRDTSDAYVSDRVVSVPIPTEGELYVRYGPDRDTSRTMPAARGTLVQRGRAGADTASARAEQMEATQSAPEPVLSRAELRELVREAVRDERIETRLDAMRDEMTRTRMDAMQDEITRSRMDAMREQLAETRMDAMRRDPVEAARPTTPAPRSSVVVPTTPRTTPAVPRGTRESGGEVERTPTSPRIPVIKDQPRAVPGTPADSARTRADTARTVAGEAMQQTARDDVLSMLDSIRAEQRMLGQQVTERTARDSLLLMRVDSIVAMRLREEDERRQIEAQRREADERARAQQAQAVQTPLTPRALRTTIYGGANFTNGTQAITGLRVNVGSVGGMPPALQLVPELALGWGNGARSTMVAGNLQYGFPTFRIAALPNLTPYVQGGIGILNFSEEVSGRDGTEGVLNLGYGVGIDVWRRAPGSGAPVLVVEHQGVDLFDLNRLLVGARWSF